MKISNFVYAFYALRKIAACDLPMAELYRVRRKMQEIQPIIDFYAEQSSKYNNDPEKISEILNVDVDVSNAVRISAPDDLKMSYSDLVALDGIIEISFADEAAE